ncbi:RAB6A-GEF complex partner protein 1 [Sphaceloma murrayae]|uniref:RAB6A-GEF complex partner protein 1 n=1 Tax=Sphaceloma murrayae TaxID=2082308 RepID=A0A2K1QXM1_9PEZI|nr:RAB6A-GEF complex partner protein 1 [Sphaceloma murrayae]
MYWPLGIPNCYSVHKTAHKSGIDTEQDDTADETGSQRTGTSSQSGPIDGNIATSTQARQRTKDGDRKILDLKTSRGGHIFATITRSTLHIWQTKPTVLLATAARSKQSLESYGDNIALLVRPDALIIVVQTQAGFLITYSLASDPNAQVYQLSLKTSGAGRRVSAEGIRKSGNVGPDYGPGDGSGIKDISVRFRMVIRIDAGICRAIALDDELMVSTANPPAIQCIRWSPDKGGSSHNTELLKRMKWFKERTSVTDMVYDRPMGLHVWLASDGKAYTVQRTKPRKVSDGSAESAFQGYCFHEPAAKEEMATLVAVNARFSLIGLACADAKIRVYNVKDYLGNIPHVLTLELPVSLSNTGRITFLAYSPDGQSLFTGLERGWAIWSVYGKLGAHSFMADRSERFASQTWLDGFSAGFWAGLGSEILLLNPTANLLCSIPMVRGAATSCLAMPNVYRSLLQTSTSLMLHKGQSGNDTLAGNAEESGWQTYQMPSIYLANQWPIKCSVVSACGKYIAAAGRRGLVHYSKASGRWKTFDDPYAESEFSVRGGMCWYQHILVAAVDCDAGSQIRLYSRERNLSASNVMHTEVLRSPVVHMTLSDLSSLLVFTHENVLFHYVFEVTSSSVKLVQVGQIGFHGIIRAPARVRSISWIVPDEQRERGDPSQDVATAAVLFLIDGKLVLLQPSPEEHRELKYDMRVIAHNVEYYLLAREGSIPGQDVAALLSPEKPVHVGDSLTDSLWYFDGQSMRVWPDVHDLISSTSSELNQATATSVSIPTDFYPLAPIISKGVLAGLEPELVQRRDVDFAFARATPRTHLFIPPLLQHYLSRFDSPAALHLSDSYHKLPYFAHALEVLLHNTLDEEVDAAGSTGEGDSPLASLLPFLSSFPAYLDIVLGCARKTELRSWKTLFRHLPPVTELFEEALGRGKLKTAGGFLLVLHTFDEEAFNAGMISRLLRKAGEEGEWELCRELARFLVGVDETGSLLGEVVRGAGMGKVGEGIDGAVASGK